MRMLGYLNNERLQDKLRMKPKNAGLTHTGPSYNDICTMPSPDVKYSIFVGSKRFISKTIDFSPQILGYISEIFYIAFHFVSKMEHETNF